MVDYTLAVGGHGRIVPVSTEREEDVPREVVLLAVGAAGREDVEGPAVE